MSAGFPNRKSWPKNANGGFKVSPYPVKRVRHEGVRCYGSHVGKKCYPYRPKVNSPLHPSQGLYTNEQRACVDSLTATLHAVADTFSREKIAA
jgi:hypothetical protein